jgi:hypothetical protein
VNSTGRSAPESSGAPSDTAAQALSSVVDNVTALARAELELAAAEIKSWLLRAGIGVALLWLALSLLQVFVLALALTPVLLVDKPWTSVVCMLLVSALPAAGVAVFAARALKKLKEPGNERDDAERPHRQ